MSEARAVFFTAPRSVEIRPVELGTADEDDILVESELIGISHGSEYVVYTGSFPAEERNETLSALSGSLAYPLKYGYINVGRSRQGERLFAFFPHQDRFYCKRNECVVLPESLDPENAVFLASMETAVSIVHDAAPRLGECTLVSGQGVVGLLTAELLLRSGCSEVISIEPSERRRAESAAIGCTAVSPESALEAIRDRSGGRGVDVAINLSAREEALQLALSAAADEATVIEASWYGTQPVSLALGTDFHRRGLEIKSSQVSTIPSFLRSRWTKERRFRLVIDLLQELQPKRYISHRFPLGQASEAFELIEHGGDSVLQIVLDPTVSDESDHTIESRKTRNTNRTTN